MMKYEIQKIVKELNEINSLAKFNVYSMGDEFYSLVSDDAIIVNKEYAKITEIVEKNGYVIEAIGTSLVLELVTRETYEEELRESEEMKEDMKEIFEEADKYREKLKEEFVKIVNEHPEAIAKFKNYYKYLFSFTTEIDGTTWTFFVGGQVDEIYRFNVEPEMSVKEILNTLDLEDVLK